MAVDKRAAGVCVAIGGRFCIIPETAWMVSLRAWRRRYGFGC